MLYIASDHAGFQLKKELTGYIKTELKRDVKDLGPEVLIETDDFPDYAIPLAKKVAESTENMGILICGSGQGTCIVANKVKGAYAVQGYNLRATELGRKDNNANILCLGARLLPSVDFAKAIVKKFLDTKFDGDERFVRRNNKIKELEK